MHIMVSQYKLKKDKFNAARGGYSRLLDVSCRKCKGHVLVYQKDGPGNLRRLYLDRILDQKNTHTVLKCKKCGEILGTYYIYQKEKRKAFRLYHDAVIKKVRKLRT